MTKSDSGVFAEAVIQADRFRKAAVAVDVMARELEAGIGDMENATELPVTAIPRTAALRDLAKTLAETGEVVYSFDAFCLWLQKADKAGTAKRPAVGDVYPVGLEQLTIAAIAVRRLMGRILVSAPDSLDQAARNKASVVSLGYLATALEHAASYCAGLSQLFRDVEQAKRGLEAGVDRPQAAPQGPPEEPVRES